jgi:DTW domain-containing protein YfiP
MTLREAIHLLPALPQQSQILVVLSGKCVCVKYTSTHGYTTTVTTVYEGVESYRECGCGELILPSDKHCHTWSRAEVEDTVLQWVGEDEVQSSIIVVPMSYYEAELPVTL